MAGACNTHYTQEPMPAEYCRARAQLILAKAVAMDPAIGRRHTGHTNDPLWLDQVTAALPKWGASPLFEPTDWSKIAVTVLDVITEQQQILHLPLWSELPGCGPETAVTQTSQFNKGRASR